MDHWRATRVIAELDTTKVPERAATDHESENARERLRTAGDLRTSFEWSFVLDALRTERGQNIKVLPARHRVTLDTCPLDPKDLRTVGRPLLPSQQRRVTFEDATVKHELLPCERISLGDG